MQRKPFIILNFVLMTCLLTACSANLPAGSTPITPTPIVTLTFTPTTTASKTTLPTNTPSPTATAASVTLTPASQIDEGQSDSLSELRGLRLALPSEKDIATLPNIWDAYHITGTTLDQPGTKTFAVKTSADQPLLVPWYWCAKKGLLAENLAHLKVRFSIESLGVPDAIILKYPSMTAPQGFECQTWAMEISRIVVGESQIQIGYTLDEAVFDGVSSYPAGAYSLNINITTLYKKKIISDKYGFTFTLPAGIRVFTYDPAGDDLISASFPQKHLADGGDLVTAFDASIESQTDSCHPLIDLAKLSVKSELVKLGGIPYTKIYTPNLYGDYRQDVEYIVYYSTHLCIHFHINLSTHYFDQGVGVEPGNMLPSMKNELDNIVSTFRWIKPAAIPKAMPPIVATEPPTATPASGSLTITREKDHMVMVLVSEGPFSMGNDKNENDQKPVHTVTLDAFWIDKTEVTNAMYALCVQAGVCPPPAKMSSSTRSSYYGDANYVNYPVINVNWNQAKAYCEWAGAELPSEAQWEKAARGPDQRIYPWGNTAPTCNLENFSPINANACVGDTSAVGKYPDGASPYGALDMVGNVWEWVADGYNGAYYWNSPSSNPTGPTSERGRVERGGSWGDDLVTATVRVEDGPTDAFDLLGFRCARSH